MDSRQVLFIKLLNLSINNEKLDKQELRGLSEEDLEAIYYESKAHSLESLVYLAFDLDDKDVSNRIIFEEWRKKTFFSAIYQKNHLINVSSLLQEFSKANIEVIALKGLIIREAYPVPEFRTMGDADLLVKQCDLDRAVSLMESLDYYKYNEGDNHGSHIAFDNNQKSRVEIHWTLVNDQYFKGAKDFEQGIWERTVEFNGEKFKCLTLSTEDLIVHLVTHMMVHMAASGFGFRQVLDLILIIKKNKDSIDWYKFKDLIKGTGTENFTLAIFKLGEKLFNMEIPKELNDLYKKFQVTDKCLDILIQEIFNSGVFGRKDRGETFAREFAYDKSDENVSVILKFIKILFPNSKDISDKYSYAKNNKVLMPIAWTHHLLVGIFKKEFSFKSKVKFLVLTISTANKRKKLFRNLNIL